MKKTIEFAVTLILIFSTAFAFVKLVSPKDARIEPLTEVLISPVGPGQEITLQFERETDESIYWESIELVNDDPGWITHTDSDSQFLYYFIEVPPDEPAGVTPFWLKLSDKLGAINPNEVEVKISVTRNPDDLIEVIKFMDTPNLHAGEKGNATFKIRNKALSTATYYVEVYSNDIPEVNFAYNFSINPEEVKEVSVPVEFPSEGAYSLDAKVWSPDNSAIDEKVTTTAYVRPTIRSKLNGIGNGFPLIPLTMAPFYAVLGVIGF